MIGQLSSSDLSDSGIGNLKKSAKKFRLLNRMLIKAKKTTKSEKELDKKKERIIIWFQKS